MVNYGEYVTLYRRTMVMVCILITETGGCRTEEAQVIHVEKVKNKINTVLLIHALFNVVALILFLTCSA